MTVVLSQSERDALEHAEHLADHLDGAALTTGRSIRKRTVLGLINKGLMREADALVAMVDDDGWALEPERLRVGYYLTDAGRTALQAGSQERK